MANQVIDFSVPNGLLDVFYMDSESPSREMVSFWQVPAKREVSEFGITSELLGILTASSYNAKTSQSEDTSWTYANLDREFIENNADVVLFDWGNVSLDSASQRDSESIKTSTITFYERDTEKDSVNLATDLPGIVQLNVFAESFDQTENSRYYWVKTENGSIDKLQIDATVLEAATLNADAILNQQEGVFLPASLEVNGVGTFDLIGDEAIIDRDTSILLDEAPTADAMSAVFDVMGMDMLSMMPSSKIENSTMNLDATEGELIIDTLAFTADTLADSVYEVKLGVFDTAAIAAPVVGEILSSADLF